MDVDGVGVGVRVPMPAGVVGGGAGVPVPPAVAVGVGVADGLGVTSTTSGSHSLDPENRFTTVRRASDRSSAPMPRSTASRSTAVRLSSGRSWRSYTCDSSIGPRSDARPW